jgi:thiamine-phosphate pyrophosphorylase
VNSPQRSILRIIDANYNRAKEGLRVIEDTFRFVTGHDSLRKKARNLRHQLDVVAKDKVIRKSIAARSSLADPGRRTDRFELQPKNIPDILYSNFQRVKESLRVLEEFSKSAMPGKVAYIKRLRYRIYALEKEVITLKV